MSKRRKQCAAGGRPSSVTRNGGEAEVWSTPPQAPQQPNNDAQREVLQVLAACLANYLPQAALANARLVCKDWSGELFAGRTFADLAIASTKEEAASKITNMGKLCPELASLTLRIGSRLDPATAWHALSVVSMLKPLEKLRDLTLTFSAAALPSPIHLTGLLHGASKLQALTVNGRLLSEPELRVVGSLTGLTSLAFTRNEEGAPQNAETEYGVTPLHLAALKDIKQLRHLELPVHSGLCSKGSCATLTSLTALTSLHVSGCSVNNAVMKELAKMTHIKSTSLTLDSFSGELDGAQGVGLARWSIKTDVCLNLHARSNMDVDLAFMAHRMRTRLKGLRLSAGSVNREALLQLKTLIGLRSLEFSAIALPQLTPDQLGDALCAFTALTSFKSDARSGLAPLLNQLPRMISAWTKLRVLHISEVQSSQQAQRDGLRCLASAGSLQELQVTASDSSEHQVLLNLSWLPRGLQRLRLRHVYLPCPVHHERLSELQELSLQKCVYGCAGHLKACLLGLPSLAKLALDDMDQLRDSHLTGLSVLTGLTSLSVVATGNPAMDGGSIMHLVPLTTLRYLRWHVGDALDFPPNPLALKVLSRLATLDVPANTYWRMQRWNVLDVLDHLPLCDVRAAP